MASARVSGEIWRYSTDFIAQQTNQGVFLLARGRLRVTSRNLQVLCKPLLPSPLLPAHWINGHVSGAEPDWADGA